MNPNIVKRKAYFGSKVEVFKTPTTATVIGIAKHQCGMKYHGDDPNKNLCANHSDSCESRNRKVSMCFKGKHCDICGYCVAHCVGHKAIEGRHDVIAKSTSL